MDVIEKIKSEGLRRKYSINTIKSYCYHVKNFMRYSKKDIRRITKKDVSDYLEHLSRNKLSGSTLNICLSAIKFVVYEILNKNWKLNTKYSRKPKRIPIVLNKSEIKQMLDSINNEKHWLIIALMYSAGLRLSEVINLKVQDLELEQGYGWVRNGKGKKDRMFIMACKLKNPILKWIENLEPNTYLFQGNNGPLNRSTIYHMVKQYSKEAKIKKNVHPHTLRHSFATHIVENGYDLNSLQRLMGHDSSETTNLYIHCAKPKINVQSPFDTI